MTGLMTESNCIYNIIVCSNFQVKKYDLLIWKFNGYSDSGGHEE